MDGSMDLERDLYVGQLQAIHRLRDELELADNNYRDLLYRLTGARSAKWMTREQRDKVIAFMTLHQTLDAAVAHAEEARETLNAAYALTPSDEVWDKDVFLEGELVQQSRLSLEGLIRLMREHYGEAVRLVGARELPGDARLHLDFALASESERS